MTAPAPNTFAGATLDRAGHLRADPSRSPPSAPTRGARGRHRPRRRPRARRGRELRRRRLGPSDGVGARRALPLGRDRAGRAVSRPRARRRPAVRPRRPAGRRAAGGHRAAEPPRRRRDPAGRRRRAARLRQRPAALAPRDALLRQVRRGRPPRARAATSAAAATGTATTRGPTPSSSCSSTDGDRVLLGRQAVWPERRYSALAGFVEPGEALEQAVAREVREETGVEVADVRYSASQPWPFPASLMLGFEARYAGGDPSPRDGELEDVAWFTREQVDRRGRRATGTGGCCSRRGWPSRVGSSMPG